MKSVNASATPLVVTLRCSVCSTEQTAIGPSSHPTLEYPGWQIEQREFYKPSGQHFCPHHLPRRRWW